MVKAYWPKVAVHAWSQSLQTLGFTSRGRIVTAFLTALGVAAVLLFWGSQDAAGDMVLERGAIWALGILAFPFVYGWHFIKAPAEMENQLKTGLNKKITDLEATVNTLRVQTANNTAARLTSSSLSVLIERGLELLKRRIKIEELPSWTKEVEAWELNCLALLRTGISHQDAVAFHTIIYNVANNFIYKVNEKHNKLLNELSARINLLKNINDRYKDHWITMSPQWRIVVEAYLAKFKGN